MYQVLKLVRSRVKKNEMEPSIFLETNPQAIVETATIKQIYDNIHLDQLQAGLAPTIPADEAPLWRKITGLTVDVTKARHCKCEYPVSPGVMWVNHNGKDIGKMGAHACCVQVAKEVNERAKRMKSNMQEDVFEHGLKDASYLVRILAHYCFQQEHLDGDDHALRSNTNLILAILLIFLHQRRHLDEDIQKFIRPASENLINAILSL
eukprot:TRINITY_DN3623_c0_g1_i2.p1 TRINITY_DN3623_c0_g1~~TRINITY_DN3623_c0_g1_i2.p1  ORF type:complete len:229 (+),score=30.80 TRINITY_DN3623_c0_g1_i2:68-688(+)